jgi:hypothetical protein
MTAHIVRRELVVMVMTGMGIAGPMAAVGEPGQAEQLVHAMKNRRSPIDSRGMGPRLCGHG